MAAARSLSGGGVKRRWRLTLATSIALLGVSDIARSEEWKPVETEPPSSQSDGDSGPTRWVPVEAHSSTQSQSIQWQELTADPNHALPEAVVWTPVEPSVAAEIEQKIEEEAPIEDPANAAIAIQPPVMPSGTTFANDKAIWRDNTWHPQISGTVPVGFGPKGLMISGSIWGIDCVTGAGYCEKTNGFDEYRDQVERIGEAQYNLSVGFGDAEKLVGVTITSRFEETSLALGNRNTNEDKNIFSNFYVGAHLSRNLGIDTGLKIGIDNWLDIRECKNCGFAKSAYGIISQRFRLRDNQNSMFPNAYLTLGLGNGQFRPLDELVLDGIRKQRDAGCATPGFTPDKPCSPEALTRASVRARSYGQINPIGAIALETLPGMNLIGEWSGRNLNAGFSVRPFEELGLVFTGMWENILPNCDYGCTVSVSGVPDGIDLKTSLPNALTQRPRFSFQASLELKF